MAEIFTGEVLLWLVIDVDKNAVVGFTTTTEVRYPGGTCRLKVVHLSGKEGYLSPDTFVGVLEVVEQFARDSGRDGVEFSGRKGWNKFAKANGYIDKPIIEYYKDF